MRVRWPLCFFLPPSALRPPACVWAWPETTTHSYAKQSKQTNNKLANRLANKQTNEETDAQDKNLKTKSDIQN